MELLKLDPPAHGVSDIGIYVIDDDGVEYVLGPLTPRQQLWPGSSNVKNAGLGATEIGLASKMIADRACPMPLLNGPKLAPEV